MDMTYASHLTVRRFASAAALALSLTAGCGDSRRIVGPDPDDEQQPAAVATLTVWTSDPSPSPIAVVVDGRRVGVLTRYWSSPPPCGDQTAGAAITIDLPPGPHVVRANETQGDGVWGPRTLELQAQRCLSYELAPSASVSRRPSGT